MSDPKPVPEKLYRIPHDAPEEDKLHLRAQMVIQCAFYAFGDPDERPGTMTLGKVEMIEVLNMATAMLLSTDDKLRTRSAIRAATEACEKQTRNMVEALEGDHTPQQLLSMLGMATSYPN